MEIKGFIIERDDYLAYARHYRWKRSKSYRFTILGYFALLNIISLFGYMASDHHGIGALIVALIPAWLISGIWFGYIEYLCPVFAYNGARKRGSYGRPCTSSMDQEKVTTTDPSTQMSRLWTGIDVVENSARHLLFYFNGNNAFVIPKRAFETPQACEAFLDQARQYLSLAKQAVPQPQLQRVETP